MNKESDEFHDLISFSFEKERYTPFTYFTASFIGKVDPAFIRAVGFYCDGKLIHYGTADLFEQVSERGRDIIRLRSYSFTKQLGQNFSVPGIISQPNLGDILSKSGIYTIECQPNTKKVNYVYINERTTSWEAICVYAMKAYRTSPFIHADNTVCCTVPSDRVSRSYSSDRIISVSRGINLGNIFSDVYVSSLNGEWDNSEGNFFADAHLIVRRKYYAYDREWVYDLGDEVKYYMNYSNRAREYKCFVYEGYRGEDLLDKASIEREDMSIDEEEISSVKVYGSSKGIFTEIKCYSDSYCNNKEEQWQL